MFHLEPLVVVNVNSPLMNLFLKIMSHLRLYMDTIWALPTNSSDIVCVQSMFQLLRDIIWIGSFHCTHVITCARYQLKQMWRLAKTMADMKREH